MKAASVWSFQQTGRIFNEGPVHRIRVPELSENEQEKVEVMIKTINRHNRRRNTKLGLECIVFGLERILAGIG